ncbi:MAG: c-type cytochrome [Pirellulaceae bacterium]|nr:c-type cytochrome [Pirellulaceae bacterium]
MRDVVRLGILGIVAMVVVANPGCRKGAVEPSPTKASATIRDVSEASIHVDLDSRRPAQKLSEYGLFQDLAKQVLAAGVVPYQLNVTSFVDHATTTNFIYLPPDQPATYRADSPFDFPVGTILVQNICFPHDVREPAKGHKLVETRLLIHKNFGWTGVPYLWNKDHTDAERAVIGGKTEITLIAKDGQSQTFLYYTPDMNQCKRCHTNNEQMVPIGVTARNLNRGIEIDESNINQLDHWHALGLLDGIPDDRDSIAKLPDWRDANHGSVAARSRAWLDANCAHCHSPGGPAIVSGLDLSFDQTQPIRFGAYKPPVAAGRGSAGLRFSILPGKPDQSFLLRRVSSTELGVMMPPLGRSLSDDDAYELLSQWIQEMPANEALAEAALNPMKAYKDAVSGGDAERGKVLFHQTQKCIHCHRVGSEGSEVGPNLSDVGKRTKPEYLLESVVDPNAQIAKQYQTEVVITDDGRVIAGVLISEDQYEVVIADSTTSHKISKDEIDDRRTSGVSIMPSLANVLTVEQVRDLIAYLVTLQESPNGS